MCISVLSASELTDINDVLGDEQRKKIEFEQMQETSVSTVSPTSSTTPAIDLADLADQVNDVAHIVISQAALEAAAAVAQQDTSSEIHLVPASDTVARPMIISPNHQWYVFNGHKDRRIGKGAFKDVCFTVDLLSQNMAAVGIIALANMPTQERSLMQREVEILKLVQGAPCVVQLQDYFGTSSEICVFMEYCSGGTLFDAINGNRIPKTKKLSIAKEVAGALAGIHALHVAHCDIKAENFLLTNDGHLKLADFGLSHLTTDPLTNWPGSPDYVSPEIQQLIQWNSQGIPFTDEECANALYGCPRDVWAAGIILFALYTGEPPWDITKTSLLADMANDPDNWQPFINSKVDKRPSIPEGMKLILKGMLTIKPSDRLTAEQMQKAMIDL